MTKLRFTKMHGLGNDFVVLDGIAAAASTSPRRSTGGSPTGASASAATRSSSSSADAPDVDFRYRIFNADGGEVEQCGNGARCFVTFVRDHGYTQTTKIRVETAGGIIVPELVDGGEVTVDMGVPRFARGRHPVRRRHRRRRAAARGRGRDDRDDRRVDGQSARGAGRRRRRARAGGRRRARGSSTTRGFRSA